MKVFYKDCKHNVGRFKTESQCLHRDNITYDWYEYGVPIKECSELNANNNCSWYEEVRYKR